MEKVGRFWRRCTLLTTNEIAAPQKERAKRLPVIQDRRR